MRKGLSEINFLYIKNKLQIGQAEEGNKDRSCALRREDKKC